VASNIAVEILPMLEEFEVRHRESQCLITFILPCKKTRKPSEWRREMGPNSVDDGTRPAVINGFNRISLEPATIEPNRGKRLLCIAMEPERSRHTRR
jgi:hypothetical protein